MKREGRAPTPSIQELTPRQQEVLELIARGKTNGEIAIALGISLEGVKYHVSEILGRLETDSREDAVAIWRARPGPLQRAFAGMLALPVAAGKAWVIAGAGLIAAASTAFGVLAAHGALSGASPPSATLPAPRRASGADPVGTIYDLYTLDLGMHAIAWQAYRAQEGLCLVYKDSSVGGEVTACGVRLSRTGLLGVTYARPGLLYGNVPEDADSVEIFLYDGTTQVVRPVIAPAGLREHSKFYIAAVPKPEDIGDVVTYDASGKVLLSERLYDPPGTAPTLTRTPGSETVDFVGSRLFDPLTGWRETVSGQGAFSVGDAPSTHVFRIEHDGAAAPSLLLWCPSGIVLPRYVSGPDASGQGVFAVDIPAGPQVCTFNVSGDGTWRVRAERP